MYAHALLCIDIEACTHTMILSCLCVHDAPPLCAAGRRATLRLRRVDRRVALNAQKPVTLLCKYAHIYIHMCAYALLYIDTEACTQTMIVACLCVHDAPPLGAAGRRATLRLGRVDRRVTPDARLAEASETSVHMCTHTYIHVCACTFVYRHRGVHPHYDTVMFVCS